MIVDRVLNYKEKQKSSCKKLNSSKGRELIMQIPESTRYEIKMETEQSMLPQLLSWLRVHPAGFYKAYPDRQVNNVYFDTPHLSSFAENLSGISVRRKMRLRWYGNETENIQATLEIKCKRNQNGWKKSQRLSKALNLNNTSWIDLRKLIREELKPDIQSFFDHSCWPVILNQYYREYYLSFDAKVRITIDFSQKVYNQMLYGYPNVTFSVPTSNQVVVVEVKANTMHRENLAEIISHIPLRVSKHSKYALGMEAIFF